MPCRARASTCQALLLKAADVDVENRKYSSAAAAATLCVQTAFQERIGYFAKKIAGIDILTHD